MKFSILFLMVLFLGGCTTVFELGSVKRGEGSQELFDLDQKTMLEIGQRALEDSGLVVKKVNHKTERVEILAYQPESLGESGSVYGLYLYPLHEMQTEIYLVRKTRYPTKAFAGDATAEILNRLDELALEKIK